jgi:argininosuccinate lyase
LSFDSRFWRQDIDGSIAFARANYNAGTLTAGEFSEIERGLKQVAEEWRTGAFKPEESDEDIHTANERRLGEIIDKGISGKLHTGKAVIEITMGMG